MTRLRILLLAITLSLLFGSRFSYAILPSPFIPEPLIAIGTLLIVREKSLFLNTFIRQLFQYRFPLAVIAITGLIGLVSHGQTSEVVKDWRSLFDFFLYLSLLKSILCITRSSDSRGIFMFVLMALSVILGFLSIPLFPELTALQLQESIRVVLPFPLLLGLAVVIYTYRIPKLVEARSLAYLSLAFLGLLIFFQGFFRQSLFVIPFILIILFADLRRSRAPISLLFLVSFPIALPLFLGLFLSNIQAIFSSLRLFSGFGGGVWDESKHLNFLLERLINTSIETEEQRFGLISSLYKSFDSYSLLPAGLGRDSVRGYVVSRFSQYGFFGTEDSFFFFLLVHCGLLVASALFIWMAISLRRLVTSCSLDDRLVLFSVIGLLALIFFVTSDIAFTAVQAGSYAVLYASISFLRSKDGRSLLTL
jgi:hypothetical protein